MLPLDEALFQHKITLQTNLQPMVPLRGRTKFYAPLQNNQKTVLFLTQFLHSKMLHIFNLQIFFSFFQIQEQLQMHRLWQRLSLIHCFE